VRCGSDERGSPELGVLVRLSGGVFNDKIGYQRCISKLGRIRCDKYGANPMKFTDFIVIV
jgi:hypothetical protein